MNIVQQFIQYLISLSLVLDSFFVTNGMSILRTKMAIRPYIILNKITNLRRDILNPIGFKNQKRRI